MPDIAESTGYVLGIDLGTTYTAAATRRGSHTEIAALSDRSPMVPSVLLLQDDETILVGDAADRRAVTQPDRVAREFKRRFGDPAPLIVGGTPYGADLLTARLLRWVVDLVGEAEGRPPDGIALTHPANWGAYKLDLLRQAVHHAELGEGIECVTISEPQAAATWYASHERVEPGTVVAVYDLGGGTFDAAVLRRTPDGFDLLGTPEGIERLGGIDFDAAVFGHVVDSLGDAWEALDEDDPAVRVAAARLRRDCVEAKEALSSDNQVTIPVVVPGLHTEVRLTRSEFEDMVRPPITETVGALRRALRSAEVEPDGVDKVLLIGGSSRIPLVAQVVGAALGRPIAIDAHPKNAVALGAAVAAAAAASPSNHTGAVPVPPAADLGAPPPGPHGGTGGDAQARPREVGTVGPEVEPARGTDEPEAGTVEPAGEPARRTDEPEAEPARRTDEPAASAGAEAEPGTIEPAGPPEPEPGPGPMAEATQLIEDQGRATRRRGPSRDPRPPVIVPAPEVPPTPSRATPARRPAPAPRPARSARASRRRRRTGRRRRWRRVAAVVTILVLLLAIAVTAAAVLATADDDPSSDAGVAVIDLVRPPTG